MKTISIAIMAALMLSIGTIVAATPASALTCTELVDGKISCVLEEGTIVVEKLTASAVEVEEQPDHVTIQVGAEDNATAPVDNGNVTAPVEEQPTDNGNVTTYPEEPVAEEPMVVPDVGVGQGGDVGVEEPFPVEEPAADEMIVP